jgi:hypothetical protein
VDPAPIGPEPILNTGTVVLTKSVVCKSDTWFSVHRSGTRLELSEMFASALDSNLGPRPIIILG